MVAMFGIRTRYLPYSNIWTYILMAKNPAERVNFTPKYKQDNVKNAVEIE